MSENSYYDQSEWWPAFVTPTRDFAVDGVRVRVGVRGVLVRLKDATTAIVDLGRQGVVEMPLVATDFAENFTRLKDGSETKRYPNLVEMLAPRMIKVEDGRRRRIGMSAENDEARGFSYFLFIYAGDDAAVFEDLSAQMETWNAAFAERHVAPLLIPLYAAENAQLWDRVKESHLKSTYMLVDYVVSGYIRSLAHQPQGPATVVLCDKDGKLLYRDESVDLAEVMSVLESAR